MSSSRQFAIMSLHAGQKVCTNYLSHSAISSIDYGKGSITHIHSEEILRLAVSGKWN